MEGKGKKGAGKRRAWKGDAIRTISPTKLVFPRVGPSRMFLLVAMDLEGYSGPLPVPRLRFPACPVQRIH